MSAAAAEAEALDAELAPSRDEWIERQRQTRRHLYSQHLTAWGAGYAVRGESRSVRMALVAHLTAMGPVGWHALPLASVGEPWGEDRAPMSRATGRLLQLGLLDRINRGPSRPSEYWITSKLIELTERAETPETQRARIEHTPQAEQEIAGKGSRAQNTGGVLIARGGVLSRESGDETTAPNRPDYVAEGSACVDCGREVTKDRSGAPNPRCKPCYKLHKRPSGRGPSWDHTTALNYQYNPYGTPSTPPGTDSMLATQRQWEQPMTTTDELGAVVEAAAGRPLHQFTVTEALDVADRLRTITELPALTPADQHLAHHLRTAAHLIERRAGVT